MANDLYNSFLSLIRLGLGHDTHPIHTSYDWEAIDALAVQHGLSAVMVDGVECLPEEFRPPKGTLLKWIGESLQDYEYRYDLYCKAIAELAGFYNSHGYKMMVLKGYSCSLNWPNPKHRPCGDIDIWQFGQQKKADEALKEKGIKVDNSHHHHTVFAWKEFTVENHYDFINVHHHKSHRGIEEMLKNLGKDDSHYVELRGERVYIPSPNLHALFLLRHALNHFTSIGINFRQVLDWAFFVKEHKMEVDWKWFHSVVDEYHMRDFYNCLNAICVEELGFDACIFPSVQFLPSQKELVLMEILHPRYTLEEPNNFIKRYIYKYKRWKGNAWKQKLCYDESRWSAFFSGVKTHLISPDFI